MNNINLIGRVTKDIELKETSSGIKYCQFNLAVDRKFKDQSGNKITDFINCVAWKSQAEILFKYVKKGFITSILGSLQNRSYTVTDGSTKTVSEVIVQEIYLLPNKQEEKQIVNETQATQLKIDDEDLPF